MKGFYLRRRLVFLLGPIAARRVALQKKRKNQFRVQQGEFKVQGSRFSYLRSRIATSTTREARLRSEAAFEVVGDLALVAVPSV